MLSRAIVPAQKLENGVARIQIIEGYVSVVTIEGSKNTTLDGYAERIKASRPLAQRDIERYVLLANDLPGVHVRAVVEPDPGTTGGAILHLVADQKKWDAVATYDNRGSRFQGPSQSSIGLSANNLFGRGDRTSVRAGLAFPYHELHYFQLHHQEPIGSDGLTASLAGGIVRGHPGFTLVPLTPFNDAENLSATLEYPIVRKRFSTWRVWGSLTALNARSELLGNGALPPSTEDRIRALRIGSSYDFADRWGGGNLVRAEVSQGLPFLGASPDDRANPSRPFAFGDFHKITFDATRVQNLDAIVHNLSLYLGMTAQRSLGTSLLAPELFAAGGTQFGRGYDPSEITGDHGIAATIEPRCTVPIDAPFGVGPAFVQPYAFYDIAEVGYHHPTPTTQSASLASAGFGARVGTARNALVGLELAHPLTKVPQEQRLIGRDHKPWRFLVSASLSY